MNSLKKVLHINATVQKMKLINKKKDVKNKEFHISTTENGEMLKILRLQKVLNQSCGSKVGFQEIP